MQKENFNIFDFIKIIKVNEKGECIITIGKYKVSHKTFESEENAKKYVLSKPWELIMAMITIQVESNLKNIEK